MNRFLESEIGNFTRSNKFWFLEILRIHQTNDDYLFSLVKEIIVLRFILEKYRIKLNRKNKKVL